MRYPRWLRLWSCVLSIGCGLIQTGAVGTTAAAESKSESATAENVPEAWTRLAACRLNLKHEGEAWREPLKIDLSFDDPACAKLHAAEVPKAERERFLRYLLETHARKGAKSVAYLLALCRLSGALGQRDFDEALKWAEQSDSQPAHRVRQLILWRVLYRGEKAPRSASPEELARNLADADYADAAPEIVAAGARLLATPRRESGRALVFRGVEMAAKNAKTLTVALHELMRQRDDETLLEVIERIEALDPEDENLRTNLMGGRLVAALRTGRLDLVDRDALAVLFKRRFGEKIEWIAKIVAAVGVGLAAWLAYLTRRKPEGPGWWPALIWAGLAPVALSVFVISVPWAAATSLLLLAFMIAGMHPERRRAYFLEPIARRRAAGDVLGVMVLLFAMNLGYSALLERVGHASEAQLVSMLMMGDGWPDILVRFALAALIIPAIEEIAFRGFLQDVASRRMRRTWAIGLVSVLFGLLHGFTFALPLAAVGVCLSILRERHRSLWVPMGAHMLNNAISFACIHLVAR
jgi:Predicted metal-dependent membrane protease